MRRGMDRALLRYGLRMPVQVLDHVSPSYNVYACIIHLLLMDLQIEKGKSGGIVFTRNLVEE